MSSDSFEIEKIYKQATYALAAAKEVLDSVKQERENELDATPVEKRQYDSEGKPIPFLVDGKSLEVGVLKDGRVILAAACRDGSRATDKFGQLGIIDPQNNEVRFKITPKRFHGPGASHSYTDRCDEEEVLVSVGGCLGGVANASAVPMDETNGRDLAVATIAGMDPSGIAFAMALEPIVDLYKQKPVPPKKTFKEKFVLFIAAIVAVWRAIFRPKAKEKISDTIIQVEALNVPLAIPKIIHSTFYAIPGSNKIAVARYATKRVPLKPDGTIAQEYLDRWQNFLDSMAARGIWKYGVMGPVTALKLATTELKWEKLIYTFFFTDTIPEDRDPKLAIDTLNKLVGYDIFCQEGAISSNNGDWSKFPW